MHAIAEPTEFAFVGLQMLPRPPRIRGALDEVLLNRVSMPMNLCMQRGCGCANNLPEFAQGKHSGGMQGWPVLL